MSSRRSFAQMDVWHRSLAERVDSLSKKYLQTYFNILMENAGRCVAEVLHQANPFLRHPIIVFAGHGNNGGDAMVAARYLSNWGACVTVYIVTDKSPKEFSTQCFQQYKILQSLDIRSVAFQDGKKDLSAYSKISIVDGIFGLGFTGMMKKNIFLEAIEFINSLKNKQIFSIDIPSGLSCDDTSCHSHYVRADKTVTFGARKPVHCLAPTRDACGEVVCKEIGFPKKAILEAKTFDPLKFSLALSEPLYKENRWNTHLPASSHKFDRGHVLIIGGSIGKFGAPLLSAKAALREGAGWVSVSTLATLHDFLPYLATSLEVTYESFFNKGLIDLEALENMVIERHVRVIVLGPGMVEPIQDHSLWLLLAKLSLMANIAIVIDAGALINCYESLVHVKKNPHRWVLLPHPGEWKKISTKKQLSAPHSVENLPNAKKIAISLQAHLVYKSATPLVLTPFEGKNPRPIDVFTEGNVALSKAGSGDVLAGIISAHLAIDYPMNQAILRSLAVLSKRSLNAIKRYGQHGCIASDLLKTDPND